MRMVLKDGKRKVFTMSYDDAKVTDRKMIEILDRHGIKATFNVSSGLYSPAEVEPESERPPLTRASAISLYKNSGHEVAVHGYTHWRQDDLNASEMLYEILEDKINIERDYGVIARGAAYPYGLCSDELIDILKICRIEYARVGECSRKFGFPKDWYKLMPTCHHNDERLMDLAKAFVEEVDRRGWCRMFFVFGHSYEFDRDDNWHVLEELAEYVGGREDIWYATNIEIYDYVQAYKRLQSNYDMTIIHNPSAIPVWVELGGTPLTRGMVYCIGAGETLAV